MMRSLLSAAAIAAVLFLAACSRLEDTAKGFPTPPPETVTPTRDLPKLEIRRDAELEKRLTDIAARAKGKVGVAVVSDTGEAAFVNANDHFPMQSVYKLPIAMAMMHAIDDEKHALDERIGVLKSDMPAKGVHSPLRDKAPDGGEFTVSELLGYALEESDGTASDVLMRLSGGADAVQLYLTAIGLKEVNVANTEKEMSAGWQVQYSNYISPDSAIYLLRSLAAGNGITDAHRDILLDMMTRSNPGAMRLKRYLPAGASIAHKTGTSGTNNGITAATNDIGIVTLGNGRHLFISVFVSDSPADEATRESVIADIGKAAYDAFGK